MTNLEMLKLGKEYARDMKHKELWEMWLGMYANGVTDTVKEFRYVMVEKHPEFTAEEIDDFINKYGEEDMMKVGKSIDEVITAVAEALIK